MDDAEIRLRVLRVTDRAVGAEAELARAREHSAEQSARLIVVKDALADSRRREKSLATRNARLATELAAVRSSETWRVGRMIVQPLSRATRATDRRKGLGQ